MVRLERWLAGVAVMCGLLSACAASTEEKSERVAATAAALSSPDAHCSAFDFGGSGAHKYFFCTDNRSWAMARSKCQALGFDFDLVSVQSSGEQTFVRSHISEDAWLGGTDSAVEGVWRWTSSNVQFWQGTASGSAVGGAYTNFDSGQPNNLGDQDCLQMEDNTAGKWNDDLCSNLWDFVCEGDACPNDPNKTDAGLCGCGAPDTDTDGDGTPDCLDQCPHDAKHLTPGQCGCAGETNLKAAGTACSDGLCSENDECDGQGSCGSPTQCLPSPNCVLKVYDSHAYTFCPTDSSWQTARSTCTALSGTDLAHIDNAAEDAFIYANIVAPAWIGANDIATEGKWVWSDGGTQFWSGKWNGSAVGGRYSNWDFGQPDDLFFNQDCAVHKKFVNEWIDEDCSAHYDFVCEVTDQCPSDPTKRWPGICGCGIADIDTDGDGFLDCQDGCPLDPHKQQPGVCGCGHPDIDSDGDGVLDCQDGCPADPTKQQPGVCGCGAPETDADFDGQPDCVPCAGTQLGAAWPMAGNCRGGAHHSSFVGAQTSDINWSLSLSITSTDAPTIGAAGVIYVGTATGLQAVNSNGVTAWLYATSQPVLTSPAIDSAGRLFFGADDGRVYAVRADSGAFIWSVVTGAAVRASPVLGVDGTVIVGNDAGVVYALSPTNGQVIWSFQTGGAIPAAPTIARNGRVLVGSADHFVYALDPAPSAPTRLTWSFDTGATVRVSATAARAQDAAYIGTDTGSFIKLRTTDGALAWSFAVGSPVRSAAAVAALDVLTFGADNGNVYAVQDQGSAAIQIWQYQTQGLVRVAPTAGADGTIYVGSDQMYALRPLPTDPTRVLWSGPAPGGVLTAVSIGATGAVVFGTPSLLRSIGGFSSDCSGSQTCASYLGVNYCAERIPGMDGFFLPPACPESGLCRPNFTPCTQLLGYKFCYTSCRFPAPAQ